MKPKQSIQKEIEEYVASYIRLSKDEEILQIAEEGISEFLEQIDKS